MQIKNYNIIFPWDSISTVHTWEKTNNNTVIEVQSQPEHISDFDYYVDDVISFLLVYIIIFGSINFINGKIHRKNKAVERR